MFGVNNSTECFSIAVTLGSRRESAGEVSVPALAPDDHDEFGHHQAGDNYAQREIMGIATTDAFNIDVQHHDHEQEQDHDRTDIDQDENDGQEFCLGEQPEHRALEKSQHQKHDGMNRITRKNHAQCRTHQDGCKTVEENRVNQDLSFLTGIWRPKLYRQRSWRRICRQSPAICLLSVCSRPVTPCGTHEFWFRRSHQPGRLPRKNRNICT